MAVKAPEQSIQDAVGGIHVHDEQCYLERLNTHDPSDTAPQMTADNSSVEDGHLEVPLHDDSTDEI